MAYQTGTAANPTSLLDSIRLFALSLGWTVSYFGDDPQTAGANDSWLSLVSASGSYFNLLANNTSGKVSTRAATGYTNNGNRNSQPNQSMGWGETNGLTGPYQAYYFFGGADYIHVVIERVTNQFSHFHIGTLEKGGNYTGGEYHTCTQWTYGNTSYQHLPDSPYNVYPFDSYGYTWSEDAYQCVRMGADGAPNKWYSSPRQWTVPSSSLHVIGFLRNYSIMHRMMLRSPNAMTGQSMLIPSLIAGPRPAGGASIYGTVKDLRAINIANISPKEIITIGTDQWMIFPVIRKGLTTQYEACSGNYGLAYRKT